MLGTPRRTHLEGTGRSGPFDLAWTEVGQAPPLLLIHDPDDPDSPYAASQRLATAWQGAEFLTTRGLGKLAHYRILRHRPAINAGVEFIGHPAADASATGQPSTT